MSQMRPQPKMGPLCLLTFILALLAASGVFASSDSSLTLGEYLDQVAGKHSGVTAARQNAKASLLYSGEGSLVYAPTLTGSGSNTADARNNPFSGSTYMRTETYSLGVSEQTPIGLTGKVSYNYLEFDVPGFTNYNNAYGQLDLSQSLLRNWNGAEFKQTAALAETSSMAKSFAQSYVTKTLLLEAESNYWRLALARENVKMQKDAVDRAQKIWDWTARRVKLQLADRSESLQASSNLQARQVELLAAQNEERGAAQAFNSSRQELNDRVDEKLISLNAEMIATLKAPNRAQARDDVRAAEFQAKATAASSTLAREKDKPTLELYGSTVITDPPATPASLDAFLPTTAKPSTVIGLRLTAPLDLGTLSKAREGYAAEAQAADWTYQRKVFEQERDWHDLQAKLLESKERLKLYLQLEKTQKEKLDFERDRQQRGRSTLQQVLLFETDYENAQLGRIRTLADVLTLNAQLKLYGENYESR